MIQFKDSEGNLQQLNAAEFERIFGVTYLASLIIEEGCPAAGWTLKEFKEAERPDERRRRYYEKHVAKKKRWVDARLAGKLKNWLYAHHIRQNYVANVYIAKVSDAVGFGAFAGEDIDKGSFLGEYTGLARAFADAEASNAYLFNYVSGGVVDASCSGNFTRFINHSELHANTTYMRVMVDDLEHVVLLAEKRIRADEQILFDYGANYWTQRELPVDLNKA